MELAVTAQNENVGHDEHDEKENQMDKKKVNKSGLLLASAAAGLLTVAATVAVPSEALAEEVKCYGINKCKGTGECGGKGHSCAGENACGGHGYLKIDKDKCLAIKGGRLTPDEEKKG